jgi:hypothetical protein
MDVGATAGTFVQFFIVPIIAVGTPDFHYFTYYFLLYFCGLISRFCGHASPEEFY